MEFFITDLAAEEIKKRLKEAEAAYDAKDKKDPSALFLRVGVRGGGCSGMSYVLEFDDGKTETDIEQEIKGVRVVFSKPSVFYLNGAELDYTIEGLDRGFIFRNPNAKQGCGCGQSFHA